MLLKILRDRQSIGFFSSYIQATLNKTGYRQYTKQVVGELLFIEQFLMEKFHCEVDECVISISDGSDYNAPLVLQIYIDEKDKFDEINTYFEKQVAKYEKDNNIHYQGCCGFSLWRTDNPFNKAVQTYKKMSDFAQNGATVMPLAIQPLQKDGADGAILEEVAIYQTDKWQLVRKDCVQCENNF